MKKSIFITLMMFYTLASFAQTSFELYAEKDDTWLPAIYELYIKEYSSIDVDKLLIDQKNINSIYETLLYEGPTETTSVEEAIEAMSNGSKVFFFVETYVWGGLSTKTTYSGSWGTEFPMCSGFYIYEKKSFIDEGLNYHCGTKDNAHEVKFLIFK